jgi:hypothetical protein
MALLTRGAAILNEETELGPTSSRSGGAMNGLRRFFSPDFLELHVWSLRVVDLTDGQLVMPLFPIRVIRAIRSNPR